MFTLRHIVPSSFKRFFDEFLSLGAVRNTLETAGEELISMCIEEIEKLLLFFSFFMCPYTLRCFA